MCEDGTAVRVRQREKQSYVVYKVEIIPSHNDATLTQHNAEVVVILRKSYNLFQDVHLQKKKQVTVGALFFTQSSCHRQVSVFWSLSLFMRTFLQDLPEEAC